MARRKVVSVKRLFPTALLLLSAVSLSQESTPTRDCTTHNFALHKTPCLCGHVNITSGDISLNPAAYGLDDTLDVELRDKAGKVIESKRMLYRSDDTFCFSGKPKGRYALAFILYKSGRPQPAAVFPANYTAKERETCNVIYPVPPVCPK